jgi:hypothetical protein
VNDRDYTRVAFWLSSKRDVSECTHLRDDQIYWRRFRFALEGSGVADAAGVLRNNIVEKLTRPGPIRIRDASRRGLVWRSHQQVRKGEPLVLRQPGAVGLDRECQVPTSDAAGQHCNDGPTHEGLSASDVRSVEWDSPNIATYASNQPFAMSVGSWHTNWRSQYVYAPAFDRLIQTGGERLVSIVQKKLVVLIARKGFPQLL